MLALLGVPVQKLVSERAGELAGEGHAVLEFGGSRGVYVDAVAQDGRMFLVVFQYGRDGGIAGVPCTMRATRPSPGRAARGAGCHCRWGPSISGHSLPAGTWSITWLNCCMVARASEPASWRCMRESWLLTPIVESISCKSRLWSLQSP